MTLLKVLDDISDVGIVLNQNSQFGHIVAELSGKNYSNAIRRLGPPYTKTGDFVKMKLAVKGVKILDRAVNKIF